MRYFFVLLLFIPLVASATPPDFDRETTLRFNTVCSHCHEGQCSGRLSFSLGPEATFTHIRRYAGDVDDDFAQQLGDLLGLMKRECAFPPLAELDVHKPVQREVLDSYRDSASGNYFIPLGSLELGKYRLSLCFDTSVPLRVEVLNEWFDFLVDHCSGCGCGDFSEVLEVDEPGKHYLRLRSQDPLLLQEVKLSPD
jgi:hypothetical protein